MIEEAIYNYLGTIQKISDEVGKENIFFQYRPDKLANLKNVKTRPVQIVFEVQNTRINRESKIRMSQIEFQVLGDRSRDTEVDAIAHEIYEAFHIFKNKDLSGYGINSAEVGSLRNTIDLVTKEYKIILDCTIYDIWGGDVIGITETLAYDVHNLPFTRGGNSIAFGLNSTSQQVAQTFTPTLPRMREFHCYLFTTGTPTDTLRVTLEETTGNIPNGVVLKEAIIQPGDLGSSTDKNIIPLEAIVTPGQLYAVRMKRTGPDDANYYRLLRDSTNSYSDGSLIYYAGSSWFSLFDSYFLTKAAVF